MIWIVGNKGMLGTELELRLSELGMESFGTDRDCDIADPAALEAAAAGKRVDWIVNCSAYTAVDRAEEEEELARRVNAAGVGALARLAARLGASLVHVSTDYVFDGAGTRPYREEDPIGPACAYGRTKAEGEALLRAAWDRHFIVRTAWLYGRHGKNFVYSMLKLMAEREELGIVADQVGSPTWARDLAGAIARIVESGSAAYGTYHFTDEGETSWYEFAREILRLALEARLLAREPRLRPLSTDQYPSKVRRPAYSVLSKEKIRSVLGIAPPDWRESLGRFIRDLRERGMPAA